MIYCFLSYYVFLTVFIVFIDATPRYYFAYLPYGTGDNIITTYGMHGGPLAPHRKWLVECGDGEAMTGVSDQQDDFERFAAIWCKFMFPYKPPSVGKYPYYPTCIMKDLLTDYFCFSRNNASITMNMFFTAIYDNENIFVISRPVPGTTWAINNDLRNPYKCCKTPKGYYIDYVSCYYMPTRDNYFEYYDSAFQFVVTCGTGYVMTGMAKKYWVYGIPSIGGEWIIEWIQCCRVGYGAPSVVSPPLIYNSKGIPTFYAASPAPPPLVTPGYGNQYRSLERQLDEAADMYENASNVFSLKVNQMDNMRYVKGPIPATLSGRNAPTAGSRDPAHHPFSHSVEGIMRRDFGNSHY